MRNIVVVGYNDSGSLLETLVFGVGGLSFNGVARSINRGRTFTDLLFLDPGPPTNFLGGDPVVACSSPTTFYYSSLLSQPAASGISVSKSSNGGLTYRGAGGSGPQGRSSAFPRQVVDGRRSDERQSPVRDLHGFRQLRDICRMPWCRTGRD